MSENNKTLPNGRRQPMTYAQAALAAAVAAQDLRGSEAKALADLLASREALLGECREALNIYRFRKGYANSDWQFERDVDALLSKLDKGAV